MDLLLSHNNFVMFHLEASQSTTALILATFKSFVAGVANKQAPNYYNLPEWDSLNERSLKSLGTLKQNSIQFDGNDFEFIRKRQFTRLFEKYMDFK